MRFQALQKPLLLVLGPDHHKDPHLLLAEQPREQLGERQPHGEPLTRCLPPGRFLLSWATEVGANGASELQSRGIQTAPSFCVLGHRP